jgi:hypothetical protein
MTYSFILGNRQSERTVRIPEMPGYAAFWQNLNAA